MNLLPGVYKIKVRDGAFGRFGYLRIFTKNKKKHFYIDHGLAEEITDQSYHLDDLEIVNQRVKPLEIKSVNVSVKFIDQDGDQITLEAKNIHSLNRIFKRFPSVASAFGLPE